MQVRPKELKHFIHEIKEWVSLQKKLGKKRFYLPSRSSKIDSKPSSAGSVRGYSSAVKADQIAGDRSKNDSLAAFSDISFSELRDIALKCVKCPLSEGRTQVVFGSGNEKTQLVFVGEAPGFDEDRQGKPFVGRAGQLLTKMIEAMGFKREDVYIANIIKCRPPNNRTPRPEEIETCLPYLIEQLGKIKPKVVCALGNVAAQTLLGTDKTISKLRGLFHEIDGIKIMPTFHPAFLLRNPEYKREVWHDLQLIMKELGLKVETK